MPDKSVGPIDELLQKDPHPTSPGIPGEEQRHSFSSSMPSVFSVANSFLD
jgi:hypothetical protein